MGNLSIDVIIQGILLGGLYSTAALGLSLVFGVMRLINLAHGQFLVLGAYLTSLLVGALGADPLLTAIPIALVMAAIAYPLQRYIFTPVMSSDHCDFRYRHRSANFASYLFLVKPTFALGALCHEPARHLWALSREADVADCDSCRSRHSSYFDFRNQKDPVWAPGSSCVVRPCSCRPGWYQRKAHLRHGHGDFGSIRLYRWSADCFVIRNRTARRHRLAVARIHRDRYRWPWVTIGNPLWRFHCGPSRNPWSSFYRPRIS
jgi:Branched-chain amino acid transport system / permease component